MSTYRLRVRLSQGSQSFENNSTSAPSMSHLKMSISSVPAIARMSIGDKPAHLARVTSFDNDTETSEVAVRPAGSASCDRLGQRAAFSSVARAPYAKQFRSTMAKLAGSGSRAITCAPGNFDRYQAVVSPMKAPASRISSTGGGGRYCPYTSRRQELTSSMASPVPRLTRIGCIKPGMENCSSESSGVDRTGNDSRSRRYSLQPSLLAPTTVL